MKAKLHTLIWFSLIVCTAVVPARAEELWRTRAYINITTPGLFEATIPPELVNRGDSEAMDLTLNGPDAQPRAFELYWREPVGEVRQTLTPDRVVLDQDQTLVWEAGIPERLDVKSLEVKVAGQNIIGRIDVEGRTQDGWTTVVRNAAVFKATSPSDARIDIPKNHYDKLRLRLSGYDRRARQALSPIKSVVATADRRGKDFVEQVLPINFQQTESEAATIIEAALPGDGLWIQTLTVATQAQFQGRWQVGHEIITNGRKDFHARVSGTMQHVGVKPMILDIEVNQKWAGRSLIIKLFPGDRYVGGISAVNALVRLPRITFVADKPGHYTAFTGLQKQVTVQSHPGKPASQGLMPVPFAAPEINPNWRLVSLLEKYQLKGGPFDAQDYTWRSQITIPNPGYYRLPLNLAASLKPHPAAIRIVKDNIQVPYITGRVENHNVELDATLAYDAGNNHTQGVITLPQASASWQHLTLHATGLFKRKIELQKHKPGNMGWQTWKHVTWQSRGHREASLRLDLRSFSANEKEIRIVIDHADNQPVTISKITASYTVPTFYFLAHAAGAYFIYGGNPQAVRPQYDLSLVQDELQCDLPVMAAMGDLDAFRRPGWKNRVSALFKDTQWGLYAVLGLVTLVLLTVIVRLFPKPSEDTPK